MNSNSIFRIFLHGVKKNGRAGLILQAVALLIVLSYYYLPEVKSLLNHVGELKDQYGYFYSAVATALFGGLIPFFILYFTGQVKKRQGLYDFLFYLLFWLWKGMEVDALYRFQGFFVGTDPNFLTVVTKVFVDQFIYCPIWAVPTMMICYQWKEDGFSFNRLKKTLVEEPVLPKIFTVLVSNLFVWVPAVSIIYSLPSNLQLVLFNLVLCFWALILNFISRKNTAKLNDAGA